MTPSPDAVLRVFPGRHRLTPNLRARDEIIDRNVVATNSIIYRAADDLRFS
jgi:hypothetical protein